MYFYSKIMPIFAAILNIYSLMSLKKQRLSVIENLLRSEVINSQTDLQKALTDKGFDVTQATLSRDVKQLKMVKRYDREGRYRYMLSDMNMKEPRLPTPLLNELTIVFSGTLAVIKTRPGYAMGIASYIDEHAFEEIIGTIAGDDTILVIPQDGYTRLQVKEALTTILKN